MLHAAWNALLKRLGGDGGVIWLSQVCGVLAALPLAWWRLDPATLTPRAWGWLALAGVVQGVYFALLGRAYARGDLSLVYPLARGGGVALAALSSAFVFHDALSTLTLAGIAAVCLGTVQLSRGGQADPVGVGLALLVAVSLGVGSTTDKLAMGDLDPAVYAVGQFIAAILVSAPRALGAQRASVLRAAREHPGRSLAIGVLSLLSYGLALLAFRAGPLAVAVALRESSVLFGAAIGVFGFGERMTGRRAAGLATVVLGLALLRLA